MHTVLLWRAAPDRETFCWLMGFLAVGCHQPATKLDCFYKCSQVPRKKDPDLENSPALVTSIKSGQHWFVCKLLTRQGDND